MTGGVVALVALGLDDRTPAAVEEEPAADQLAGNEVNRAVEELDAEALISSAHERSSSTRALTALSVSRASPS